MARPKKTGMERPVTTTIHIPAGVLDRIDALGYQQSTFIRTATMNELMRQEGFVVAIEIQSAVVDKLLKQVEDENEKLHELHKKHKKWKKEQEISRVKNIVIEEVITENHFSMGSLLLAAQSIIETDENLEIIVEDVWKEFKSK